MSQKARRIRLRAILIATLMTGLLVTMLVFRTWRLEATGGADEIPAGTVITRANWQNYRSWMSKGMEVLFAGKYFWRLPDDVQIVVGPTIPVQLPTKYSQDTEKFSQQVKLRQTTGGGFVPENYVAGLPFPNATEPNRGTKIMYNVWYRYAPFFIFSASTSVIEDSYGNISTSKSSAVNFRLSHLSIRASRPFIRITMDCSIAPT